jgi:hypothetical protein
MTNARWFKAIGITLYVAVSWPASAQISPAAMSEMRFPWKPGQLPDPFWVVRTREPCLHVQGRGGMWVTQPVVTLSKEQRSDWVCSYTWTSPNTPPDLPALRRLAGAIVEPDPPIVLPNADPERDLKWFGPLNELARARLAIPDQRPLHEQPNVVRVVVLDTAASTPNGLVDPVGHGRAVGRLIEELACGDLKACATEIQHVSALPFISDPARGMMRFARQGGIGTRAMLAAAIERASSEWAATPEDRRPRQLVINMSCGWSGCWELDAAGQTNSDQLYAAKRGVGSEAVLQSIVRATCRGALVVAASGNGQPENGCPTSPPAPGAPRYMFPGLWGGAKVDPALCERMGVPAKFSEARPLLIGVSAVDQNDNLLSIAGSSSDIVGFGQFPTFPEPAEPSGWTLPLSGTSMSAAAFSGIAAGMLSYEPDLPVTKLLPLIRESSVVLPIDPATVPGDFICNQVWNGASCNDVRRLSLCNALSQVRSGIDCKTPEATAPTPAAFQTMSPLALAGAGTAVDCDTCGSTCPDACKIPVAELDSQSGPWVIPQPAPPGCTTCAMVPLLPIFQGEFHYPVGSLVLIVKRPIGPSVRIALQTSEVPALMPTTWLLPLSALGGISARLGYRASSSLALESGDVLVTSVPPFSVPCGILSPCP